MADDKKHDDKSCPNCGHCPTCGKGNRGGYWPPNYWPWGRYPWTQPYITPTWYSSSSSPNQCASHQSGLSHASNAS